MTIINLASVLCALAVKKEKTMASLPQKAGEIPSRTFTFYVAFSIHGTNAFISASRKVEFKPTVDLRTQALVSVVFEKLILDGFKEAVSRRANRNPKMEMKLTWDMLSTKEGKPLRSVPLILSRFKRLEKDGWTVDKAAFMKAHYHVDGRLKSR